MKKSNIYLCAALAVVRNCIVVGEVDADDIDVLQELLDQRGEALGFERWKRQEEKSEAAYSDAIEWLALEPVEDCCDRELRIGEAARPADDPGDAADPFGGTFFPGGADGTDEDGGAV